MILVIHEFFCLGIFTETHPEPADLCGGLRLLLDDVVEGDEAPGPYQWGVIPVWAYTVDSSDPNM